MKIIDLSMSPNQYMRQVYAKKNVFLHHTVSSNEYSPLRWWTKQPDRIGTAYVAAKSGEIVQAFPEQFWAHHLGIKGAINLDLNRRSIGVEIVNEGFLFESAEGLRWLSPTGSLYRGKPVEKQWRNGRFWASYTDEQLASTAELVVDICKRHKLPLTFAPFGEFNLKFPDQYTVCYHHNVRIDKTDLSPAFDHQKFEALCHELSGNSSPK